MDDEDSNASSEYGESDSDLSESDPEEVPDGDPEWKPDGISSKMTPKENIQDPSPQTDKNLNPEEHEEGCSASSVLTRFKKELPEYKEFGRSDEPDHGESAMDNDESLQIMNFEKGEEPCTPGITSDGLLMSIKQETLQQIEDAESSNRALPIIIIPRKRQKRLGFNCTYENCDKAYSKQSALKIHMRMKHEMWHFKCDYMGCGQDFPLKSLLQKHQLVHENEGKVMCDVKFCCKVFASADELHRHAKRHSEVRPIPCVIKECTLTFKYPKAVDSHLLLSHPGVHTFPCEFTGCGKVYHKFALLKRHEGVHCTVRSFVCPYENCQSRFTTDYYRNSHVWKCHRAKKKFACDKCDRAYKYPSSLTRHLATHEPARSKTLLCPTCGKAFASKDALRGHSVIHSNDRPFLCTECGMKFPRKNALTRHAKMHLKGEDVSKDHLRCPHCGVFTSNRNGLAHHMRVHGVEIKLPPKQDTGEVFACTEPGCTKTFKHARYLQDHRVIHYPECHVCSICGKDFKCYRYLKAHMKSHTDERKHVCMRCGKAFKTIKEMTRHAEIHEDVRKYVCQRPDCGRSYKTASTLRIHMRLHKRNEVLQRDFRSYKSAMSPNVVPSPSAVNVPRYDPTAALQQHLMYANPYQPGPAMPPYNHMAL